jgi:dynein heavy chain 1
LFVLLKKLSISKIKEPKERCHLYFLTSWFNSVVGERLRYTPLGWSKKYEFNESDFKCALDTIDAWVDLYSRV